jgi:hypothetical protein
MTIYYFTIIFNINAREELTSNMKKKCFLTSIYLIEYVFTKSQTVLLGHLAELGEMRNIYKLLIRITEGRKPLEKLMRRRKENVKNSLKEIMCEDVDWINLAREKVYWRAFVNSDY